MTPQEPTLTGRCHGVDDASHPLDHLPATHPVWGGLLLGQTKVALRFLAARILLARLARDIRNNPSPEALDESTQSLHGVYARNRNMPCARDDLAGFLADWHSKGDDAPTPGSAQTA